VNDDDLDRAVRVAVGRSIREGGVIPTIAQVADELGRQVTEVDAAFARMTAAHVFIPREGSHEIYAYDPFCVGPTDFRVRADDRDWWAICGWDALGIPPALGTRGTIDARCGDCREPIRVEVGADGTATAPVGTVLQVGVPARAFWDDIYFT
jgi:hypothetical protein